MSAKRRARRETARRGGYRNGRDLPVALRSLAAALTMAVDSDTPEAWPERLFFIASMHAGGVAMLEASEIESGFAWLERVAPELLPEAREAERLRAEVGADSVALLVNGREHRFVAFLARPAPTSGMRCNAPGGAA
jgi:hypothetical protein